MCLSCSSSLSLVTRPSLQDKSSSPVVDVYGRLCCLLMSFSSCQKAEKMLELVPLSSLGSLFLFVHCICSANRFWCDEREDLNSRWWKESLLASSSNSRTTSWVPSLNSSCLHPIPTVCQLLGIGGEGVGLFNLFIPYILWTISVNSISEISDEIGIVSNVT